MTQRPTYLSRNPKPERLKALAFILGGAGVRG